MESVSPYAGNVSPSPTSRLMIDTLVFLHRQGVVHRDIKLENFMLEDDTLGGNIQLIDFGSAAVPKKQPRFAFTSEESFLKT